MRREYILKALKSNLSDIGHIKSCVNQQESSYKAKQYSWMIDNKIVLSKQSETVYYIISLKLYV